MRLWLVAPVGLVLCVTCLGQEVVWESQGVRNEYRLGDSVVGLGDLNGDGFDDLLQIGWKYVPQRTSQLFFLSGKDGTTIRTRLAPALNRIFTNVAAAGDMDGDQVPDYIASTSGVFGVEVRSGADDALIFSIADSTKPTLGSAFLGNVDLDADRLPDLVLTAPLYSSYGALYAYGSDGSLLYEILGTVETQFRHRSGTCLGKIGDFDADGSDDFVAGIADGSGRLGAVVVSGREGRVLTKGLGPPLALLGHAVDGAGDINGDGVLDFAASTSGGSPPRMAVVFSGRTGETLFEWSEPGTRSFGISLKASGVDFDQDGVPDVAVGASGTGGSVSVYSGRDGSLIHCIDSLEPNTTLLGARLEVLPPQPGHPFPVLVAPERDYKSYVSAQAGCCEYLGRVRMFRGNPSGASVLGAGCVGTLGVVPRIGMTDFGPGGVRIHLSGAPQGSSAFLMLGVSSTSWLSNPLPMPLNQVGLVGCQLRTSIEVAASVVAKAADGVQGGYAFLDLPIPLFGGLQQTLNGQWFVAGRESHSPGAVSAALTWVH